MAQTQHNLDTSRNAQGKDVPALGGIRFGPAIAGALYLLLVGSAALALWTRQFPGELPRTLELAAPWVFLLFVACFALYRLSLVRAKKYPAFKALFQIGAALLFFTLLLPAARKGFDPPADPLEALMQDPSPRVRALAAEVARYRPDGVRYRRELVQSLRDPDINVRAEAHRSLVQLSGVDLGPSEDPAAVKAWREKVY